MSPVIEEIERLCEASGANYSMVILGTITASCPSGQAEPGEERFVRQGTRLNYRALRMPL